MQDIASGHPRKLDSHSFNLQNSKFGFLIERRANLLVKNRYIYARIQMEGD
jgi:hypothetical protein